MVFFFSLSIFVTTSELKLVYYYWVNTTLPLDFTSLLLSVHSGDHIVLSHYVPLGSSKLVTAFAHYASFEEHCLGILDYFLFGVYLLVFPRWNMGSGFGGRGLGFPGGSAVKNPPAMQEMQEMQVPSLGWELPWRGKWQPTPVFLPGQSHGQRSLVGCSPNGHKWPSTHTRNR